MNRFIATLASVGALTLAVSSAHAITIDGTLDAAYGAATAHVGYDPGADTGNFGQPGHPPSNVSNNVAYDIYLNASGGFVNVFLQGAGSTGGLDFANLYFDLDPVNLNGSDIGFEVTNDRAFVPGMAGVSGPLGLDWAFGTNSIELRIANALFTGPIAGLTYYPGRPFPGAGDKVTLRLSQSLGYSVAGGPSYGVNRLGTVTLGAVPEPGTWLLMMLGFGGIGAMLRRRKTVFA